MRYNQEAKIIKTFELILTKSQSVGVFLQCLYITVPKVKKACRERCFLVISKTSLTISLEVSATKAIDCKNMLTRSPLISLLMMTSRTKETQVEVPQYEIASKRYCLQQKLSIVNYNQNSKCFDVNMNRIMPLTDH